MTPTKESAPMSDLSAEKVVAELRARQRAHVGMHGNYYQYSGVDGLLDQRAADLIAQQAARLEESRAIYDEQVTRAENQWKAWEARATAAEADKERAVAEEREACRVIAQNEILRARGNPTDLRTVQQRIDNAMRARACLSSKKEG